MADLTELSDADLDALLSIRHFERQILELFDRGEISGTTHTCLGQEYIPVALSPFLGPDDLVLSNHRGHGHYLARFDDAAGLLAEIMGRRGAVCGGRGGSQHIHRPGFLSSGVQGQLMPVAVGAALDMKATGSAGMAVVFIGDGTWGEGVVYEALNLAQLWQVPLLIVVENNGIAQSTPFEAHLAGSIEGRAEGFGCRHIKVTSLDVNVIRRLLAAPVAQVRAECRPLVVEFETHRIGPHSKGDDSRDEAAKQAAAAHDWYRLYQATFPEQFQRLDAVRHRHMADTVAEVSGRPLIGVHDA
ncbi:thiamine pyrophosphate-dependent dehydrogenase E1 component subunit alpha [Streptacidiphilus griseoplanus]|uniref:thiamine pyrophosphate-dependent dehydrogenase E1 component subunit alpha n=1 Tax=Peterkaempfera griseoplana TaxID=66896 RepID=UPI000B256082|nr:thiamine pyrophosphate-dependent dehydrogenase E1 component subunit alpha [Peterkaempfera griseoplana]